MRQLSDLHRRRVANATTNANWFPGLNRSDISAAFELCNSINAMAASHIDIIPGSVLPTDCTRSAGSNRQLRRSRQVREPLLPAAQLVGSADCPRGSAHRPLIPLRVDRDLLVTSAVRLIARKTQFRGRTVHAGGRTQSKVRYVVQFPAGGRVALGRRTEPWTPGIESSATEMRELPGGSSLDATAGIFAWAPPVYLGTFHLVFLSAGGALTSSRRSPIPAADDLNCESTCRWPDRR